MCPLALGGNHFEHICNIRHNAVGLGTRGIEVPPRFILDGDFHRTGQNQLPRNPVMHKVEWPSGSSHSVVVIALRDKTVVPNFLSVFLKTSQSSDVSQSVSVLHDTRFTSYRIGSDVYHVGTLSPWIKLNMLFERFQWLMVACILFFCFLIAIILRSILRKKARARLQGNS